MANPQFLACDVVEHFGARRSGVHGDGGVWADFPTLGHAENFALYCYFEGFGVYLSRTFKAWNRVVVRPTPGPW